MFRKLKLASLALSILVGGTSLIASSAFAETKPIHEPAYRLELVEQNLHAEKNVPLHVRLVALANAKTGTKSTPITGAVFDPPKLVMLMPGMAPMPGHAEKVTSDADGTYGFVADLVAPGDWTLDLTAKVPGKDEPVHDTLALHVEK